MVFDALLVVVVQIGSCRAATATLAQQGASLTILDLIGTVILLPENSELRAVDDLNQVVLEQIHGGLEVVQSRSRCS